MPETKRIGGGDMSNEKKDTHHLLFPRRDWDSKAAKALRSYWYLMVEIPTDTLHAEIHRRVKYVPVPSTHSLESALEQLQLVEEYGGIKASDPIEKRLTLLCSLFEYSDVMTAYAIKKELQVVLEHKKPPA